MWQSMKIAGLKYFLCYKANIYLDWLKLFRIIIKLDFNISKHSLRFAIVRVVSVIF
jgi:hypothetical protein